MLAETSETNIFAIDHFDRKLTDWTLIKWEIIFAIQSKLYRFLSNGTGDTRFNPIHAANTTER